MSMSVPNELCMLAGAALVGLLTLVWATFAGASQRPLSWLAGPRDDAQPPLTGMAGRLTRAYANFMETFPLFATFLLVAWLAGDLGPLTHWGAALYVAARALYVPLYAWGVKGLRTVVWVAALVGLLMVLAALVL